MTAPTSTAVIRQWARDNGLPVGERGRLSPELLSAYASTIALTPAAPKMTTAAPVRTSSRRTAGAVRIPIQPTPGATGIAHKITARSS
jgi:ATP-dependent DNA helicase PIF1